MTDKEESKGVNIKIKGVMSSKVRLTDILGEVFHAIKVSDWKNERAKNNNAYVPTMKEHVANIFTHGVLTYIHISSYISITSRLRSWCSPRSG